MTIYRNEGNFDSSNVELLNGTILRYDKHKRTSRMEYIDYGLGVFQRAVFERLSVDQFQDLAGVYQTLLDAGQLGSCEVSERFYEIGSLEGIRDLEEYIVSSRPGRN